jgi:hypothetical protein
VRLGFSEEEEGEEGRITKKKKQSFSSWCAIYI